MISRRRIFAGCALCAATGLVATAPDAEAQQQPAVGPTRTILQTFDVPNTNLVTHLVMLQVPPNLLVARHTHPGIATGYVLEGELEFVMQGRAPQRVRTGESVAVPPDLPHTERSGPAGCRAVVHFTVEKGKPLAIPAPE